MLFAQLGYRAGVIYVIHRNWVIGPVVYMLFTAIGLQSRCYICYSPQLGYRAGGIYVIHRNWVIEPVLSAQLGYRAGGIYVYHRNWVKEPVLYMLFTAIESYLSCFLTLFPLVCFPNSSFEFSY